MNRTQRALGGLACALLTSIVAGCERRESRQDTQTAAGAENPAGASGASIYALDLALTDDGGRTLRLADLRGHTLVAAMMYTSCTSVCPRVTEDMKAIQRELSARDKRGVTFALFSLDPGRDTPAALRGFAGEHGLDASWRLFATSEDSVRDLATVLGVKYRRDDDGTIAHSAMIFVIDREGVVRHRQVGLGESPRDLIDALAHARS